MIVWCAWPRIFPCAICWWTATETSVRWTATRRRLCGIPEARLEQNGHGAGADIDKDTIDYYPNFDDTLPAARDPVLPVPPPALGEWDRRHCWGMATPTFLPYNLGKWWTAAALIENPELTIEE